MFEDQTKIRPKVVVRRNCIFWNIETKYKETFIFCLWPIIYTISFWESSQTLPENKLAYRQETKHLTVNLTIFHSNDIDQTQKLWNAPREMAPPMEGRGQSDADSYDSEVILMGYLKVIAWLVLISASHNLKGQKPLVCSAAPFIPITLSFDFCASLIAG